MDRPFYIGRYGKNGLPVVGDMIKEVHFHAGLELGAVYAGSGVLYIDGKELPLRVNDVFFMDAAMLHNTAGPDLGELIVHMTTESVVGAHIDQGDLRLMQPFVALRSMTSPVLHDRRDLVILLCRACEAFRSDDAYGRLAAWTQVQTALIEIARSVSSMLDKEFGRAWVLTNASVTRAMEYVAKNCMRPFSLADLADHVTMSQSRLSHIFKEHTRLSPIEYRNQLRIAHAIRRIKFTDDKLEAIAVECGFRSMSQFHTLIKRATHQAPGALRAQKH